MPVLTVVCFCCWLAVAVCPRGGGHGGIVGAFSMDLCSRGCWQRRAAVSFQTFPPVCTSRCLVSYGFHRLAAWAINVLPYSPTVAAVYASLGGGWRLSRSDTALPSKQTRKLMEALKSQGLNFIYPTIYLIWLRSRSVGIYFRLKIIDTIREQNLFRPIMSLFHYN